MAFLDDFDKKITSWGRSAVQKTRDMSDSAKVSMQLRNMENRKMELYAELGKSFYELHRNVANEREGQLINSIAAVEAEIRQYQEQIHRNRGVVICRNCGAEVSANSRYCNVCGKELKQDTFPPENHIYENESVDSDKGMGNADERRKCKVCGAPIAENQMFCIQCGTAVEHNVSFESEIDETVSSTIDQTIDNANVLKDDFSTEDVRRCRECGAVLEADQMFCVECGASVIEVTMLKEEIQGPIDEEADRKQQDGNLDQDDFSEEVPGKKCPNCGTLLEDDQLFCVQCGTRIE